MIPMEVVGKTADACQKWLALELANWKSRQAETALEWAKVPKDEKGRMGEEFLTVMKSDWMGVPEKSKL